MKRIVLVLGCALAAAGCGVTTDGAIKELGQESSPGAAGSSAAVALETAPSPTPGQATVDGVARGSLTPLAARAYLERGGATEIRVRRRGEDEAFAALCGGQVDMVDSSRPISRRELARCRAAGLTPVQLQIAADAVVVATKAGEDVGADCLTVGQVREMYRAGSPVYDWSQVGFADIPLEVGGPDPDNNVFSFFGREVLGAAEPSLTDLRSDYRAAATDRESRLFVTGNPADVRVAAQRELRAARLEAQRTRARRAEASRRAARSELREARRQRRKGIADGRSAAAQARDARRVRRAEDAASRAERYAARTRRELGLGRNAAGAARAATRRQAQLRGRVAYFRFSYYELYEDELRPMEISARAGGARTCVFPSQQTITDGSYPLARQLLITTTTAGMRRREVRSFLSSYLGRAPELATARRLVPLPEQTLRDQQAWLAGERRPTIVVDPAAPSSAGSG